MIEQRLTADLLLAEAGRFLLAEQLQTIQAYEVPLRSHADGTAVHETRKAVRRTLTLFRLFSTAYKRKVFRKYRRQFKRFMSYLGPCRDTAVFRANLQQVQTTTDSPNELAHLLTYWDEQQRHYDGALRSYLETSKQQTFLSKYKRFTESPGRGVAKQRNSPAADRLSYHLPVFVYERAAAVRASGERLENATDTELHRLRIRFKELRYTLEFFEPLLSEDAVPVITVTKQLQEHLGHLHDASVALTFLDATTGYEEGVEIYRAYQKAEYQRLVDGLSPLWATFDTAELRECLALALGRV